MDEEAIRLVERAKVCSQAGLVDDAVHYIIDAINESAKLDAATLDLIDGVFKKAVQPYRNLANKDPSDGNHNLHRLALKITADGFVNLSGDLIAALDSALEKCKDQLARIYCKATKADILRYQCEYACACDVSDDVFADCASAYTDAIGEAKQNPQERLDLVRNYACFLWNCTDEQEKAVDEMEKTVQVFEGKDLGALSEAFDEFKDLLESFKKSLNCQ